MSNSLYKNMILLPLLIILLIRHDVAYGGQIAKDQLFSFKLDGITFLNDCIDPQKKLPKIVKRFYNYIDLTDDGKDDIIEYSICESNIHKPFVWTMKILINSKCSFLVLFDDSKIDNLFYEPGCGTSYEDCKIEYYSISIKENSVENILPNSNIFKYNQDNINIQTAESYVKNKFDKSTEESQKIVKELFLKYYHKGAVAIKLPGGLLQNYGLFVWSENLQGFILVYEE